MAFTAGLIVGLSISLIGLSAIAFFGKLVLEQMPITVEDHILIKNAIEESQENGTILAIVNIKYERLQEIQDEQLSIQASLSRPSAGASHSRYRNDLVARIKELEDEKLGIYKDILEIGVDPVLQVFDDTATDGKREIKMSDAVAEMQVESDKRNKDPYTGKVNTKTPTKKSKKEKVVSLNDFREE